MNRLPGLDFLRAIAIVWVMLFHGLRYGAPYRDFSVLGWMGVDLFFVLSGFLIGSQVFKSINKRKELNIGEFYISRAFRILPAYFAVLAIYLLAPITQEGRGLQPLWQFFSFSVNLFIDSRNSNTFSHVWSLCVEEHFYLFFPLIVLLIMKRSGTALVIFLSLLIVTFGMYLRGDIWLNQMGSFSFYTDYVEKIYYPSYTRLDGLLAGVLLATIKVFRPHFWQIILTHSNKAFVLGALGLALSIWLFKDRFALMASIIGFPILSISLAFIVASASSTSSILGKVKVPGAYLIATLAFSYYLTHKSVFHLVKTYGGELIIGNGYVSFLVYGFAATFVASVLYFTVERPFLKLRSQYFNWKKQRTARYAEVSAQ